MSVNATKWAWDQKTGGTTEKTVLLALADWASPQNGHGREVCWYGQKSIALRCECSVKTVERTLAKLQEMRLIKRVARYSKGDGGRTSDLIFLNVDGGLTFEEGIPDKLSGGITDNLTGGITDKLSPPPRQNDGCPPDKLSEEPKNKNLKRNLRDTPLAPLKGGVDNSIYSFQEKGEERAVRRTRRPTRRRSMSSFVPDEKKLQEALDRAIASRQQETSK